MLDSSTQQFMYRVFIALFAAFCIGILGFMIGVGIVQGDGEAVRIIDALQPIMLGAFTGLCGVLGIHSVVSGSVAKVQAQAQAPYTPAPAPDNTLAAVAVSPVLPSATPQPQAAPQPVPSVAGL